MSRSAIFTLLAYLWLHGTVLAAAASEREFESADHGIPAQSELRLADFHASTPLEVPGARTVTTPELRRLLQAPSNEKPLLFDVLGGDGHASLPGAIWLPDAGRGASFDDSLQARLALALEAATHRNRERPVAFFCAGPRCWLSYNAALRAVRLGYRRVLWYRGGIEAWGAGGGALERPRVVWKR